MTKFQDRAYLTGQQYSGANNLSARIRLHEQFTVTDVDLHRYLFDLLLAAAGSRAGVLEVGAGRGDLWRKNSDRVPAGWNVTLTDLSDGMLADNRAYMGELAARFTYQQADAAALPFPDAAFDVVIANYMLYHVPDLPGTVRELRRVLRPGGVLMAATNGHNHMTEMNALAVRAGIIAETAASGLMGVHLVFTLQDGAQTLGAAFDDVARLDYPTHLRVTEAQPLIDYMLSMVDRAAPEKITALRALIEAEIAANGAIHIRKETGVFLAR